jgi:hypothetical protein
MEPVELDEDDQDSESLEDEESDAGDFNHVVDEEDDEEEPSKKKRHGKSQAQKDHNAAHDFTVVSAKLISILQPGLPQEFKTIVVETLEKEAYALSEISQRARMLSNYHLARCLTEGLELPSVLDQSFYKACCTLL